MKRQLLYPILALSYCSAGFATPMEQIGESLQAPRNISMIVADGIGPAYTKIYLYFADSEDRKLIKHYGYFHHY